MSQKQKKTTKKQKKKKKKTIEARALKHYEQIGSDE